MFLQLLCDYFEIVKKRREGESRGCKGRAEGEVKGVLPATFLLYLKAFLNFKGRGWKKWQLAIKNSHLMKILLPLKVAIASINGSNFSHVGNKMFPAWEHMARSKQTSCEQ